MCVPVIILCWFYESTKEFYNWLSTSKDIGIFSFMLKYLFFSRKIFEINAMNYMSNYAHTKLCVFMHTHVSDIFEWFYATLRHVLFVVGISCESFKENNYFGYRDLWTV